MAKPKIIIKEEFDWDLLNPILLIIAFLFVFAIGLMFIVASFIPLLNMYVWDKFLKDDILQSKNMKNPLMKEVKYKLIKRVKVIEEVLERV